MLKFLLILLSVQIESTRCLSVDMIIRGNHDMFSSHIKNVSTKYVVCHDNGYCTCVGDYKTFLYNSTSKMGQCVKDGNIITDKSERQYLKEDGKCLSVCGNDTIKISKCKDALSDQWLWLKRGKLLNLRTLKCLQETKEEKLVMRACNTSVEYSDETNQRWSVAAADINDSIVLKNDGHQKKRIRCTESLSKDIKCKLNPRSYKGCYRFSDGHFLHLVNKSEDCRTSRQGICSAQLYISAPIIHDKGITKCSIKWKMSTYSNDGRYWHAFSGNKEFSLVHEGPLKVTLKIRDTNSLLKKWPGRLLKLNIKCRNDFGTIENHCVLLKIPGSSSKRTIVTDNPAPIVPSLAQTSQATSSMITPVKSSSNSTTIVIIAVVVACLLVAVVAVVLFCYRRKRSDAKDETIHLYEESNPYHNAPRQRCGETVEDPSVQFLNGSAYECPGKAIPSEIHYEYPTFESNAKTQNPSTPFTYDYATREGVALITLEDLRNEKSYAYLEPTGVQKEKDPNENIHENSRTSNELPFYHTLGDDETEDDDQTEGSNKAVPVYNVLEGPQCDGPKQRSNDTGSERNSGPVYNVLEGPLSDENESIA